MGYGAHLRWVDINPARPFATAGAYGLGTLGATGQEITGVLQIHNFSEGRKNRQWRLEDSDGVASDNATMTISPTAFALTKTGSPGRSGVVFQRTGDPENPDRTVFKGTLNKRLLADPLGTPDKSRVIFGVSHNGMLDGEGAMPKWGSEAWLCFGIWLGNDFRSIATRDRFIILQFHPEFEETDGTGNNPVFSLHFKGGGASPNQASLVAQVRRQLNPSPLNFTQSRTGGYSGEHSQEIETETETAGWPSNQWAYFVVHFRTGYVDDPQTQVPAAYRTEWEDERLAPFVKVYAKLGDSAPLALVLDHQGRWGNNDEKTPNINSGMYYYFSPEMWSEPLPSERSFFHSGLFGVYAATAPDMTPEEMLRMAQP